VIAGRGVEGTAVADIDGDGEGVEVLGEQRGPGLALYRHAPVTPAAAGGPCPEPPRAARLDLIRQVSSTVGLPAPA